MKVQELITIGLKLNTITSELLEIQDKIADNIQEVITKEEEKCTTSKKSEQGRTKNLHSFLKKPTSQEEKKEDN